MTFANDEQEEQYGYLEQKYHALVRRMGASQEDIDAIEEELIRKQKGGDKPRGNSGYPQKRFNVDSSDPESPGDQYEPISKDSRHDRSPQEAEGPIAVGNHHSGGLVNSYEIYGENPDEAPEYGEEDQSQDYSEQVYPRPYGKGAKPSNVASQLSRVTGEAGMISGEHVIENKNSRAFNNNDGLMSANSNGSYAREERWDRQKGSNVRHPTNSGVSGNQRRMGQKRESSAIKKTQIEVLDHETPLEEYQQMYYQNEIDVQPNTEPVYSAQQPALQEAVNTESADLFNTMYINVTTSEAMTGNEHIRQVFKLDQIKDEEDLHNYKNLLNAMGAIFYTDHGMKEMRQRYFMAWLQLLKSGKKVVKKEPSRAVPAIQIDTELANKEYEDFNNGERGVQLQIDESSQSLPSQIDPNDKDAV